MRNNAERTPDEIWICATWRRTSPLMISISRGSRCKNYIAGASLKSLALSISAILPAVKGRNKRAIGRLCVGARFINGSITAVSARGRKVRFYVVTLESRRGGVSCSLPRQLTPAAPPARARMRETFITTRHAFQKMQVTSLSWNLPLKIAAQNSPLSFDLDKQFFIFEISSRVIF